MKTESDHIENIIFQHECAKLLGANTSRIYLPENMKNSIINQLLEEHKATLTYVGLQDDGAISREKTYVYSLSIKE